MKKKSGWLLDAAIGLTLSLVVFFSYLVSAPFLESLELKAFDMRSELRQSLDPATEIVLISIDDDSLAQIGRWPWPRYRIAAMIDKLAEAGPRVIGLNILFSEPERNDGLIEIERLRKRYEELVASRAIRERKVKFGPEFSSAMLRLDSDSKLMEALERSGKVVLPMFFTLGGVQGARPEELPLSISSSAMTVEMVRFDPEGQMPEAAKATYPLVALAEKSRAVGHVNLYPEFDGVVRREVPVIRYGESYYPSYALQLVLAYLGMTPTEAVFKQGEKVQIGGNLTIPLDANNGMLISFNGPAETFRYYPFHDVMNGRVTMDAFKDKIVIIGLTAVGVSTLYVTPVAHNFHSIEVVANVIENILHRKFLSRPVWAANLEMGLLGFIAFFIMFLLPRLRALMGAVLSLLLMTAMLGAGTYLFIHGEWVKVTYPTVLLLVGYLVIISKRFLVTEKGKELVEADAIETNKMLGLTFQGKGDLDLAFEKFRRCPLDEGMMETLYNLSLDFERKRQYAKAVTVLSLLSAKDPKFKDIETKMPVLKQASEGAVFGGVGAKKEGTVMITEGSTTKPTLGRYEIEKELGRGSMGVVYLGRDPKINRKVAIKTMNLEDGSDDADAKEIKERFFREAESAGTLNHPNIVRIFDAGEENEVAFIAMELLDGADLTSHTPKDKLFPPLEAMEHVAVVAEALSYAHSQGIVHRDIKPANIMLLKDGSLRVADFGIARITASSKTATGTVMGTPSYMSPEQVQGKKVDGRADIFSLTVTLFEFLTGEKPFKGGEGIGTLLFQIANDPHPNILTVKPDLPPCVAPIIDKGLAKNPDERFTNGNEMAAALRACIAAVKSGTAGEARTVLPAKDEPVPKKSVEPAPQAAASVQAEPPRVEPPKPIEPAPIELPKTEAPWAEKPAVGLPSVEPPKPMEPAAPVVEISEPAPIELPKIEQPKPVEFVPDPAPIEMPKPVESPEPAAPAPEATVPPAIELPKTEAPWAVSPPAGTSPVKLPKIEETGASGSVAPAPVEPPKTGEPEAVEPAVEPPKDETPKPAAFVPDPEPAAAAPTIAPIELPNIEIPKPAAFVPDPEPAAAAPMIAPIELPSIEIPKPAEPEAEITAPPAPGADETVRLAPGTLPPLPSADPDATIKLDPKPKEPE